MVLRRENMRLVPVLASMENHGVSIDVCYIMCNCNLHAFVAHMSGRLMVLSLCGRWSF